MTLHPAFAAAVISIFCSVEDWQLTIFDKDKTETICAKDEASCKAAQRAIKLKYWPIVPADVETSCEPLPGCFKAESNCIEGFNCK